MRLDLKIAILTAGTTQRRLAFKTGIPEPRVSAIVRGYVDPKPAEEEAIAASLGRDRGELFSRASGLVHA